MAARFLGSLCVRAGVKTSSLGWEDGRHENLRARVLVPRAAKHEDISIVQREIDCPNVRGRVAGCPSSRDEKLVPAPESAQAVCAGEFAAQESPYARGRSKILERMAHP